MKKCCFVLVFTLFLPFFVTGCKNEKNCLNEYTIVATYDDFSHTLECNQKMTYTNNSTDDLTKIDLFLYANSFENTANNASSSSFNKAYKNGESYGNITINSVSEHSQKCDFELSEKRNILTVVLLKTLKKDEKVTLDMDYVVTLANVNHRLGYGENTINFGSFAPVFCVYEDGFVHNDFAANGDPFYSEVSNYHLTLNYPSKYTLASTGIVKKNCDGKAEIIAEKVRDFCFVLSERFDVLTKGNVSYYFYDDKDAQKHLKTALKAVEFFENKFGKYPYEKLSVVKTNFCFGGMEYPNLVMISDEVEKDVTFDYVIVHEIAHQWWYGLVGNNEFKEAWVDESLTEYSSALFFENFDEYKLGYDKIVDNALETYKQFTRIYIDVLGAVDERMNKSLSQFGTEPEYVNCVYTKGVLMYDNIREILGDRTFFRCLKKYFKTYCFKNVNGSELVGCFSKTSHKKIEGVFKAWIDGKVVVQ